MLCQFTVKNFKSIRDEVTFDMQAAAISEHEDRIIKDVDEELYLPVSAVYGPNGGGKSNVLEALHSLVTKILRPLYATSNNEEIAMKMKKLVIEPFAFDEGTRNEPTEFELFFRTTMAEYRYELTVKKEVIEYERLDRIKLETGRKSALFERDEDEIILKGAFARLKTSDELSDTLPLLSYLGITYSKNEVVQDVLDWFDEEIDFLNYGNPMQELRMPIPVKIPDTEVTKYTEADSIVTQIMMSSNPTSSNRSVWYLLLCRYWKRWTNTMTKTAARIIWPNGSISM